MSCQSSEDQSAHAKVSPFVSGQEANAWRLPTICSIYSCTFPAHTCWPTPQLPTFCKTFVTLICTWSLDPAADGCLIMYIWQTNTKKTWYWQILWVCQRHQPGRQRVKVVQKRSANANIQYRISEQTVNFDARPAISWPSECRRSSTYTLATPTFQKVSVLLFESIASRCLNPNMSLLREFSL